MIAFVKVFVITCFIILVADGANFTVISMEGKDVKVDIPNLGPFVRIELVIDYNKKIKNWYHPMIKEDYNYTVVGDKGLFEIFNVTSEKTGFYKFIFAIPEKNKKYSSHVTVTLDVIMADLECSLEFPEDFIHEIDCPNIEKSKIGGVCALKLYRQTNENFTMKWRGLEGGRMQDFTRVERLNLSYIEAHQADVPLNMNDAFECHVEQTNLQCSKQLMQIYARKKSGREFTSYHTPKMTHENKHNVICQENTSSSFQYDLIKDSMEISVKNPLPWWAILLIVLVVILAVAITVFLIWKFNRGFPFNCCWSCHAELSANQNTRGITPPPYLPSSSKNNDVGTKVSP